MTGTPPNAPAAPKTNGKPDEAARAALERSRAIATSLGAIVSILMRSSEHRAMPLGNLEWLVGPPLATEQFAIVEARDAKTGAVAPVAVVMWAMVSSEVDERLSNVADEHPRLEPKDWRSGPIPWIIIASGEKHALSSLMDRLVKSRFKDTPPKIRLRDGKGRSKVGLVKVGKPPTS